MQKHKHFFPQKWAEPNFVSFQKIIPDLFFVSFCKICAKPTGVTILPTQTMHYRILQVKSSKMTIDLHCFLPIVPPNKQTANHTSQLSQSTNQRPYPKQSGASHPLWCFGSIICTTCLYGTSTQPPVAVESGETDGQLRNLPSNKKNILPVKWGFSS